MSRITHHPILGSLNNSNRITFQFNGQQYEAYEHETIAAALLANGIRTLRVHEDNGRREVFTVISDIVLNAASL